MLGSQATVSIWATDITGNFNDDALVWSFGVQEQLCGEAEFYGLDASNLGSTLVLNSLTPLVEGTVNITAYNPTHKEQSWVQNTRIKNITLMYRKAGSSALLPALDVKGYPVEFFDDV